MAAVERLGDAQDRGQPADLTARGLRQQREFWNATARPRLAVEPRDQRHALELVRHEAHEPGVLDDVVGVTAVLVVAHDRPDVVEHRRAAGGGGRWGGGAPTPCGGRRSSNIASASRATCSVCGIGAWKRARQWSTLRIRRSSMRSVADTSRAWFAA